MSEKTILLVEDDQDQVVLAMRALRKHGILAEVDEVVVVRTGEGSHDGRDATVRRRHAVLYLVSCSLQMTGTS